MKFSIIELTKITQTFDIDNDQQEVVCNQIESSEQNNQQQHLVDNNNILYWDKQYQSFDEFIKETHLKFDIVTKTIRFKITPRENDDWQQCFFYHVIQNLIQFIPIENLFIEFQSTEFCTTCWKYMLHSLNNVKYLKLTFVKNSSTKKHLPITLLDLLDEFQVLEILEVNTDELDLLDLTTSINDIRFRPYVHMKELRITNMVNCLANTIFNIPFLFPNLNVLEITYKLGIYHGLYNLKNLITKLSQLKIIRLILFDDNRRNIENVICTLNDTLDVSDILYINN